VAFAAPGNLGPYRLLNVVHTGQTSQIWQAYHDVKKQVFGVKTLLSKFQREKDHVSFLRWEYAVGQKAVHERVIHIFAYGDERGSPYLAMEWFPAPNMKRRIQLGIDKIAHLLPKIVTQAAEGLGYFNQLGWVHRDVKPDNFLVNDDAEVKLIDFALARRSKRGLAKLLSPKSRIQGTRSYMSPEQIRGTGVDQRADIYSFGCTLYELFAGIPPFTGTSADELLRKHLRSPPPVLEAVNKDVTAEFSDLVRRSLSKKAENRPESFEAFLSEFRTIEVYREPPEPPS